ncbi:MAG: aminotransferase class V-fold PLP-dependent enzyme, partial [Verrucomicrobiae bacterium]|nr:aminotransferase class V-fold PLP-dependent enzyme [Verrucomicrobiae bacterium]
ETVAPPIHFLKPVWEDSEKRIGFSEESAPRAKVFEQLEDGFRNLIQAQPVETVLFTDSARVAWELLLGVLRQKNPGRDEVILPSYGCRGTYDPIVANGLVPVFADIDERLLTPEEEILSLFSERTLAVLLVHLGGLRLDTSRIVDEARRRGIVTVEDYCQRTGPRPAGPRADASLFSFGMGKNLMATAGGAVLSSIHGADLRAAHAELAETPAEMARRRFAWRYAQFFEDAPPDASSRQIGATEELESYPRTAMSTLDAELMIEQIRRWKAIVIGRKAHAATLAALLGSPGCPIQAPPLQDHSCTKFSVLVDDRRRFAKFLQHLGSRGIDAELMYTPLHLRHFASGHLRRALPSSENLYPRVVNLPVRPNLSAREFFRVARALGDFIAGGGHA